MNILLISTPQSWRGGEQQLAYLAEEFEKYGVNQYFICAEGGAVHDLCLEREYVSFGVKTGIMDMLANGLLIKRICRNYKIDFIYTNDSKAHTMAYVATLLGNKTPLIVSRRVDFPVGKTWFSRKKYNHPAIKAIICDSKAVMEITGRSIVNKSLLKLVYDGIETQLTPPESKPDLRAMFNLPDDCRIIANVAALAPHKDYFTFLDTVAILKMKRPELRFLMIGEGPQRTDIEAYVKAKEVEDVVTMTGFRKDAKDLIWGFDVFLITSETEGLGGSILDTFARHVPVVATAAGGIPEIVLHEKTGLLAPVKDPEKIAAQVERMLDDNTLRNNLVKQAGEFVKDFDFRVIAEETLDVIKKGGTGN